MFFLPSRHLGAIYLLDRVAEILENTILPFFYGTQVYFAARKQNAIAGSASDIDIAIIFDKKKHLSFLLSLQSEFKIKFHNNYNSLQLFHALGLIDISLINIKNKKLELIVDIPLKKRKNTKKNKIKFIFNSKILNHSHIAKFIQKSFVFQKIINKY